MRPTPTSTSRKTIGQKHGSKPSLSIGALSLALSGVDAPCDALRRLLSFAIEHTNADTGAIVVSEDDAYTVAAAHDAHGAALPDSTRGLLSNTVVNDVLVGRGTVCVGDVARDDRYGKVSSLVSLRVHSVLCLPIVLGRKVVGALYLGKIGLRAEFSDEHVTDLTVVAAMAVPFVTQLRRSTTEPAPAFDGLIGESSAMMEVRRLIEKIGPTDLNVLVIGETGTGKELTAKAIHETSRRSGRALIATNCSALADGLLEAELFGCKKGAFTGAVADREGRIEAANGSTLFLDEVGDMPLSMQAALLRVLQEREVVRLGENRPRPVDFRLVAATNKDLEAEVGAGRFREDLLFRLREVVVPLPPLRLRGDDTALLARLFLRQCERQLGLPVHALSKAAEATLSEHGWPGNVRELRAAMRRAAVLSDGPEIRPDDLALSNGSDAMHAPPNTRSSAGDGNANVGVVPVCPSCGGPATNAGALHFSLDLPRTLTEARDDFMARFVTAALSHHGGNREAAAAALGISLRSLYRYLSRSGGTPEQTVLEP